MKKVIVASWTQSQGAPIARVMTSARTRILKPVMQTPHRIINVFSRGSSMRHFKWRCSCKTSPSKRIAQFRIPGGGGESGNSPLLWPLLLLRVADQIEDLHRVRAQVRDKLVLDRLADLGKAAFVNVLDDLDADFLELGQRLVLELERHGRLVFADLVGRRLYPFLLLIGQATPHLVANEQRGV